MKIISKFRDYYDTVNTVYGDKTENVYVRHTKMEDISDRHAIDLGALSISYGHVTQLAGFVLYFCGKEYHGLNITLKRPDDQNIEGFPYHLYKNSGLYSVFNTKVWSQEEAIETFKHHRQLLGLARDMGEKFTDWDADSKRKKVLLACSPVGKPMSDAMVDEFHHRPKCAITLVTWVRDPETWYRYSYKIIHNPCLKDWGFMKVLDAYQTRQELDMFVGGVLQNIEKDTVKTPDKYKIMAHGFDTQYGFRKRPPYE